eukprot:TRINITY_DN718_c0_g1_i4.p1 TRINITY_DN718_c0_g1~~TRINITY_DN718_c0_g1_i4.p1  ORF type:complete len:821 (-),score=167.58 TRINITY_DN718_c0_g1_i4:307-2769(-)
MERIVRDPNSSEMQAMGINVNRPSPSPATLPTLISTPSSETLPNLVPNAVPQQQTGTEGSSPKSNKLGENDNNNSSDNNNNNNNDPDGAEITIAETKEELEGDAGSESDEGDNGSDEDEKKYSRQPTVPNMLVYFVFLIVFVGVSFSSGPPDTAYWLSIQVQNAVVFQEFHFSDAQFKKVYGDINNVGDFWNFLTGPFIDNVWMTNWYNGQELPPSQLNYINYAAKIVGPVRLRQKRVRTDACKIPQMFTPFVTDCYAKLSLSNEDTEAFGPNNTYTYSKPEGLYDSYIPLIYRYNGGGYIFDLDKDMKTAQSQILSLKENSWVDLQTRVVFIDFTVYDPNMNLFCSARLSVEFPPATGAVPDANFVVSRIFHYITPSDFGRLVFEIVIVCFVIFYAYQEITEMRAQRTDYLKDPWNFVDCLNILVFIVVIIIRIFTVSYLSYGKFSVNDNSFGSIFPLVELQEIERNISATNAFICWFRLFKYVRINKRLSQLTDTLSNAAADIVIFMCIFFIVFFGYAQAGWMLFSVDIDNFRTLVRSMYTLLRQILGDFDFDSMEQSSIVLGPLFFFSFSILVLFILMNMFLAIINDTYSEVKMNSKSEKDKGVGFKTMVTNAIQDMKATLRRDKSKVHRIRQIILDADFDKNNLLDQNEIIELLKKNGDLNVEGVDLQTIIATYDQDKDGKLTKEEVDDLLNFFHEKMKSINRMERAIEIDQPRLVRQLAAEGEKGVPISRRNVKASVMSTINSTAKEAKAVPTTETVMKKIESLETKMEEIIALFHTLEESIKPKEKKREKIPNNVLFSVYGNKKPPPQRKNPPK